jgi:hypothetical protein
VAQCRATGRRQIALSSPSLFVFLALVAYAVAYFAYGKWYDRQVWAPDGGRTTPAHMYMDGVEYFPTSKYVLWGYQFKSVAALGPILGPFIALQYGWLPALIWIILGNFFIGWMQDYGSIMVSVRNRGRSFGPIAYEFTGAKGRSNLLGFVLAYLLIISAAFIFLIATFWSIFPGTFLATIGVTLTGVLAGWLLYRRRMNVGLVTLLSIVLVFLSVVVGNLTKTLDCQILPHGGTRCAEVAGAVNFGLWNVPFWAVIAAVFLYLAAVLPLPKFIQPINYVSFFPAFAAIIFILVGALISPFTNISLQQPAWKAAYSDLAGPIWPILFVAIACGAISGWHSLVGSSSTSKQLDVETDAHPVGAGAMLSEGLLALASLAAYMVLASNETAIGNIGAWVAGSVRLRVHPGDLRDHGDGPGHPVLAAGLGRGLRRAAGPADPRPEARRDRRRPRHPGPVRDHGLVVEPVAVLRRVEPAPRGPGADADHDPPRAPAQAHQVHAVAGGVHDRHHPGGARVAGVDLRARDRPRRAADLAGDAARRPQPQVARAHLQRDLRGGRAGPAGPGRAHGHVHAARVPGGPRARRRGARAAGAGRRWGWLLTTPDR